MEFKLPSAQSCDCEAYPLCQHAVDRAKRASRRERDHTKDKCATCRKLVARCTCPSIGEHPWDCDCPRCRKRDGR